MGFELPFVIGPEYIAVALFGVVIGIIFGAIPGMTATMAVAVFLPLTYAYSMEMALYLLLGLYVGGISGGLVPAILINIPGTPSSVCTTFDGHPMALRGEGERALKIGVTSSFMGGMISLVVLALFTPILAGWAIKFSAVEKFLIILFALTVIAALSRGQMLRGLWIGMLGVLVAMMNQFSVNNEYRMIPEFLESQMQSGFQLFPVLIGLFAVSEMLQQCETGMHASYSKDDTLEVKNNVKFSLLHDFKGQIINVFRSALLGTFMGILPGVGGSAASLIAYSQAKSWSKHPELLGTGVPEGLIASETSNNGLTGGALVPLLSLGIPGDSTTAVLIGAFMLQGIQVGPLFITNNPVIWNTILVALLCCNRKAPPCRISAVGLRRPLPEPCLHLSMHTARHLCSITKITFRTHDVFSGGSHGRPPVFCAALLSSLAPKVPFPSGFSPCSHDGLPVLRLFCCIIRTLWPLDGHLL